MIEERELIEDPITGVWLDPDTGEIVDVLDKPEYERGHWSTTETQLERVREACERIKTRKLQEVQPAPNGAAA